MTQETSHRREPFPLPALADREQMRATLARSWEALRNKRVFLTGGTGFVGKWLLSALVDANEMLGLGAQVAVLTRDAQKFRRAAPPLAESSGISLHQGDVRDFAHPTGHFDFVVHAATDVAAPGDDLDMFTSCVLGTQRVLDFATLTGAQKTLVVSSGAVYGQQPPQRQATNEACTCGPELLAPASVYGEAKRAAECLASIHARRGLHVSIARCFAFVGPYLPLDRHFAIGNFISAALAGRPIQINGDGTPLRTYMYGSDLAVWLWSIMLGGRSATAYNVGGESPISIADLATRVAELVNPGLGIVTARQPAAHASAERYVPDTSLARAELGLMQRVDLDEAITRTAEWFRAGIAKVHDAGPAGERLR